MTPFAWHKRLLPITSMVMALLFVQKAVGLAREVTGQVAAAGHAQSAPPAIPTPSQPAASAPAGPPPPSAAELQLLQDLRKRRLALDSREHQLDQRAELVDAAERKLQSKLDELDALQARLEQVEASRVKRDKANWDGLVKTYEDMKPRDAAAIFNVLDLNVLLEVMDRMDERKAASVLSAMLPERARLATQMLAQKRIRAETIPQAAADVPASSHS